MKVEQYQELKTAVEEKQRTADRAAGAFDQALQQLEKSFGCKTVEEAKARLTLLEAEEQEAKAKFETALEKLKKEWGHVLDPVE